MADLLILSEAYSDMTGEWEKGGKYRVELIITQTSDPGQPFTATVDEVTDYGDAEMDDDESRMQAVKSVQPKPSAKETKAAY